MQNVMFFASTSEKWELSYRAAGTTRIKDEALIILNRICKSFIKSNLQPCSL